MQTLTKHKDIAKLARAVERLHNQHKAVAEELKTRQTELLNELERNEMEGFETDLARFTVVQSFDIKAVGEIKPQFLKKVVDVAKVRAFAKIKGQLPDNFVETPKTPYLKVTKK